MVTNLQCLGEESDSSILLLPGFFRLHKISHLEFECSSCQEAFAKGLTQMMEFKNDNTLKDEPMEDQDPINISKSIENLKRKLKI